MITERTLRKWRADALKEQKDLKGWDSEGEFTHKRREMAYRILKLTQELLDQYLIGRGQ